jgi:uncharacterized protein YjbJ (UPF0337 family)
MCADVIRPHSDNRSAAEYKGALEKQHEGGDGEDELTVDTVGFGGTKVKMHSDTAGKGKENEDDLLARWDERKNTVREHFPKLTDKDVDEVKGNKSLFMQKLMEHYRWTRDVCQQKIDMWTGGDLET